MNLKWLSQQTPRRNATVYLHGGAGKTGTSFLQVQFARHAEELRARGVIYPEGLMFDEAKAGEITSGNGIELANYFRLHLPHRIEDKEGYLKKLATLLQQAEGADILISSEFLVLTNNERGRDFLEMLHQVGYRARYIFFVRNFDAAAIATYSQFLKREGDVRCFEEFLPEWNPAYSSAIEPAIRLLGRENVSVFNYDEHKVRLDNFFFREVLKLDLAPSDLGTVNRSLSPKEAALQRLINIVASGSRLVSTFVSDAVVAFPGNTSPFLLTADEAAALEARLGRELDYVNNLVEGEPVRIYCQLTDSRETSADLSEFESFVIAVLGKLVARVVQ